MPTHVAPHTASCPAGAFPAHFGPWLSSKAGTHYYDAGGDLYNVFHFDAVGDGVTNDTAKIQDAIDTCSAAGGGTVYLPPATYLISKDGANAWCLQLRSNVNILGAGWKTTLKMANAQTRFVRPFSTTSAGCSNVTIAHLTIDGNRVNQTDPSGKDQQHAFFLGNDAGTVSEIRIHNCFLHDMGGDGIALYNTTTSHVFITNNTIVDNDRSGVSVLGTGVTDAYILGNTIKRAGGSAIDMEPTAVGTPTRIFILGNSLGASATSTLVVALGGTSASNRATKLVCANNVIQGGILSVIWADDVVIEGNIIDGETSTLDALLCQRTLNNLLIRGNRIKNTTAGARGIYIASVTGEIATGVTMTDNIIDSHNTGIEVATAQDIRIQNNQCTGQGAASSRGIYVYGNVDNLRNILIDGNLCKNYNNVGVQISRVASFTCNGLTITTNTFDDTQGVATQTVGVNFAVNADLFVTHLAISNNMNGDDVTAPISGIGTAAYRLSGQRGAQAVWSVSGTPEGVLTAPIGSLALRRDGGVGTTTYNKTSGTGSSGWTALT